MTSPQAFPRNPEELRRAVAHPLSHPDLPSLRKEMNKVMEWSLSHFYHLGKDSLGRGASRAELEALLRESPPEDGTAFSEVLQTFCQEIAPRTLRLNHPRFMAFVPAAPTGYSMLGDWLCAALNCFAGVWAEAASASQIELIVLDWFKEFLGYSAEARGILTSGGSEANLTALVVARHRLPFEERSRAILYQSNQRHWSVDKAVMILGLQPQQIRLLPVGTDYRLHPEVVQQAIQEDRRAGKIPWAVVANAGATNTGVVDDLAGLSLLCRDQGLWLHVDGAYGWASVLSSRGKELLKGIDQADSITCDPHKWLAQTFEAGCVLIREGRLLQEAFQMRPEYLQDVLASDEEINFCDHGPALTRRFRALKIWLSMKVLGVSWFRGLIDHCLLLAEWTEYLLREGNDFEILSPRELTIVCFRFRPVELEMRGESANQQLDELNHAIVEEAIKSRQVFFTSTQLENRTALRLCYVNWRTTGKDVEEVIYLIRDYGMRIWRKMKMGKKMATGRIPGIQEEARG